MTQHEFDRLSEKYLAGQCTEEEVVLLRKWAGFHFDEQSKSALFDGEKQEEEAGEKIWKSLKIERKNERKRRYVISLITGIAASLVFGFFLFRLNHTPTPSKNIVSVPLPDEMASVPSKVTLPDGSSVMLEEGADIVADKDFGLKNRKVWLRGEAFFDVRSNPRLPFIVQTEDLVTEVLGTSFRIKPQENLKKIEVSVVSGKVSVYTAESKGEKRKDGVIAMPNQKVSYDLILKTLKQNLVDSPRPVLKVKSSADFLFDEVPVEKVLSRIGEIYGVQVIAGTPDVMRCIFTGDLNGLDMYRQLDFLCEVVGARYEVRGTAVFVSGTGCQAE